MDLRRILAGFASGALSMDQVEKQISIHSIEKIGEMAKLDVGREVRRGVPEIVLAERKEYKDVIRISSAAVRRNGQVVVSRIKKEQLGRVAAALRKKGMVIEIGRNSTTLLASEKRTRRAGDRS